MSVWANRAVGIAAVVLATLMVLPFYGWSAVPWLVLGTILTVAGVIAFRRR